MPPGSRRLKVRFGEHPDFMAAILETLAQDRFEPLAGPIAAREALNVSAVLPLRISDYDALYQRPDLQGRKLWLPDRDIVRLCDDKLKMNDFLRAKSFTAIVPEHSTQSLGVYPVIVKKVHDENGENSFVAFDKAEEEAIIRKFAGGAFFVQRFVTGRDEYAVHVLAVEGEAYFVKAIRHVMAGDHCVKGARNIPERSEATRLPKGGEIIFDILRILRYTGVCCVNLKGSERDMKLLEINPRFGYSLCRHINEFLDAYIDSFA